MFHVVSMTPHNITLSGEITDIVTEHLPVNCLSTSFFFFFKLKKNIFG